MDIDKLIEALKQEGILEEIQSKRLTTTELPARVYVGLTIASLATKKSVTNCLSTAIETYLIRNKEKHFEEIKLQAAAQDVSVEEYLVRVIATRIS
jgi:hypothetical protein